MISTAAAAPYFLPFVVPICIWVAFSDMKMMRIPNVAVGALLLVFVIGGLFLFPFTEYLWRLLGGVIVLAFGFVANMARALGAGDAKFAAATAPFVAFHEAADVIFLFAAMLLVAFATHRVARRIGWVRRNFPDWKSWTEAKFPMGLALGATLAGHLVQVTIAG